MERESSLSYSQDSTTGPCPWPDESSTRLHVLFKINFNIIITRGCIHKFPDWPPGARTANGTALCTRQSCIAILWVSLVSFATITLCVASQPGFIVLSIYFVIHSLRKLLDTPSYLCLGIPSILNQTKILYALSLLPCVYMPRPFHLLRLDRLNQYLVKLYPLILRIISPIIN
jgi:hypothetical protein